MYHHHPQSRARTDRGLLLVRLVGALIALALVGGGLGCTGTGGSSSQRPPAGDASTLALVALAVDYHKKADLALASGTRGEAKEELEALLVVCERYEIGSVEAWDVRFDAATRLALLHAEDAELDKAEIAANRGLPRSSDAPNTLFRGYLLQTLADIKEKKGDARGAVELHAEAIEVFKGVLESERGGLPPRPEGGTP